MSGSSVARDRGNALKVLFGRAEHVLIGVVHLLPLPGSPDYDAAAWRRSMAGLSLMHALMPRPASMG